MRRDEGRCSMKTKRNGSRNEHRTMALFEASGYRCTRSAASLGPWDVICIGASDFILVQVKSNSWPGSAEMKRLKLFVAPPNSRRLVYRWRDRVNVPDIREL